MTDTGRGFVISLFGESEGENTGFLGIVVWTLPCGES